MTTQKEHRDTFVVAAAEKALSQARKLSYFYWVEKLFKTKSFFFVDVWTLGFLALSFVIYCLVHFTESKMTQYTVLAFSGIRVFEYLVYLCWVLLFAKPNKGAADLRSYRRSLLLMMANYLETIFWFATWNAILVAHGLLKVTQGPPFIALIRESVMLMVANWSGNLEIKSEVALAVVTFQDFTGLFMTVVIGARIVSLLRRPSSGDPDETLVK
jgi:hypothetical protein